MKRTGGEECTKQAEGEAGDDGSKRVEEKTRDGETEKGERADSGQDQRS